MSTIEKWKYNKLKIRIIGVAELLFLVIGAMVSFKYGGRLTTTLFMSIFLITFVAHIITLVIYWRCPSCNKIQPFWEKHHRASVGSLSNCVYCGVPYV
ncbi:hypothetical protein LCGC14_1219110 [marine sediment metagenome]|uniref:Uncharacterized protein n=1 Tax=marine sediment metagenome TaxID=412755 RepID=A0A0F9LBW6_9ZZZZ